MLWCGVLWCGVVSCKLSSWLTGLRQSEQYFIVLDVWLAVMPGSGWLELPVADASSPSLAGSGWL